MPDVLLLPGVPETEAASMVVDQLGPSVQARLVAQVREHWRHAPPARPHAVGGRAMHVKVSSAGRLAWWGDGKAYRYLRRQPGGAPLPPIPEFWVELWHRYTERDEPPDTALVNWYPADDPAASIGFHADRTEHDLTLPILTLNLGRARWAVRRQEGAPVSRCTLEPGAVVLLDGPTRLLEHSIERLVDYEDQLELGTAPPPAHPFVPYPSPLPNGRSRISITLRIAGDPAQALRVPGPGARITSPAEVPLSWDALESLSAEVARRFRPRS
ncbi:MAG: alpha-ketoglutarate-dependent dioxygenase AlkB [Myxococcales bacterium]|nr:alpha-ketoglutarate-dependent dioxygenase AlkB [Myxococcales bacterium]